MAWTNERGKGHLAVSAERCADVLIFKVKDNGIRGWIRRRRLAEVCAMLKEDGNTKKENDGFGLFNVDQRIRLHYVHGIWTESASLQGKKRKSR